MVNRSRWEQQRPTNPASSQPRSGPALTNDSGIDSVQVAEVDISPGDIIQDYIQGSSARLEVMDINTEKVDYTTVRHVTFRDVDTEAQVNRTWRFAISNQTVVGGPKLEDVRRNPSAYPKHLSHHIWKVSVAKQFAVAS